MSDVAIRVEGLGKSYLIGHEAQRERYTALRDVLASGARRFAAGLRDRLALRPVASGQTTEEFWALKDVNFEIRHGEVVGIIGRNGAGKSTLLKVLSRITEPTTGRVTIDGRVASLLEVGTGFHPELTGRENIYLNGAILGMGRAEIRRKFDEIVNFAEVERFLDTPVKRYSSGMYVRLAFAVAAHLEPDILVVDEVLAVGDAEFQNKCLGKMQNVAGHGRTVLFVSHNMAAVKSLCKKSLFMAGGCVEFSGDTSAALQFYNTNTSKKLFQRTNIGKDIYLSAVNSAEVVIGRDGEGRRLVLDVEIYSRKSCNVNVDLRICDQFGAPLIYATTGNDKLISSVLLEAGQNVYRISLDISNLVVGTYGVGMDISTPFVEWHDRIESIAEFSIETQHWSHVLQPTRQDWGVGCIQVPLKVE